ncbi:MAG: hemerythrin domain-containing protein [Polyangiaceae bacterium]|nr:hemerythrin domain-containing protein [Myxococcales bacterium]MCB9589146.1 hemerythrin domain-containing protein [Polyangiaceae bacterium]MCB9610006.1 hemerythrin domain-containing protein [Polyangiaceae bacterium]
MTIFERLRADHDVQRTLMKLVVKTHGDSRGRRELFERLKKAMETHAEAEERAFYATLLSTDMGREHAAHSVKEHEEIRDKLEELANHDMSSSGWVAKAKVLCELNEHHMAEEEHEIFQVAGKALSEQDKQRALREFEAYYDQAQAAE